MTITITQTDIPSRSKQAGPCWIAVEGTYASTTEKAIDIEVGAEIKVTGKVTLNRSTRVSTDRKTWTVRVTGDPADTVTCRLGSPQAVEAVITGVREV